MKQTRITSKPDGDAPLVEVEAVAIRKEAYFGNWTCPYKTGHQLPVKLMQLPSA